MTRYIRIGQQWHRAELEPGVHPLDYDAAQRVVRWVPCPPPACCRPNKETNTYGHPARPDLPHLPAAAPH